MSPVSRFVVVACTVALTACGAARPPGPPAGGERVLPWGAVPSRSVTVGDGGDLEDRLDTGLDALFLRRAGRGADDPVAYRILALSGGGSRGAFAAGFLTGWTEAGTRPKFDVITGISTGALLATFAFLGPDHDDGLRVYTEVSNAEIYDAGSPLRALGASSVHDTAPLRALIESQITGPILDAVAREHAAGRRLFVGTTNLETGQFTIWDMGEIAASERPDRAERYHDVLQAAAAFPVMFPPVYIPVEIATQTYWEAHVDGAARAAVFARMFMLEAEDAIEQAAHNVANGDLNAELYALFNMQPPLYEYREVKSRAIAIAERSIDTMLDGVALFSADALFRMAMFTGTDFYASFIPSTVELSGTPLDFDLEQMARLFEVGREMALSERPFIYAAEAPKDPAGLLEAIDPDESYETDIRAIEREAGIR